MITESTIEDLVDDPDNANKGTERGQYMLDSSISEVGVGRGVLCDKNNRLIGGNKTKQAVADAGFNKIVVVETEGDTLVVTKRIDMDLNDPNNIARKAAYYDNRVAQISIDFDVEQMLLDEQAGLDFSNMFFENEIMRLENIEFKEYDESIANEVEFIECPECGHKFPK
jgi:hypothetical protein